MVCPLMAAARPYAAGPRAPVPGPALDREVGTGAGDPATVAFEELHAASSATPAQTATDSVISRRARRRVAERVTELVFIGCPRFVVPAWCSFAAQCVDGRQSRRSGGGVDAEDDADSGRDDDGECGRGR
jgi:hypothetical protein